MFLFTTTILDVCTHSWIHPKMKTDLCETIGISKKGVCLHKPNHNGVVWLHFRMHQEHAPASVAKALLDQMQSNTQVQREPHFLSNVIKLQFIVQSAM